MVPSHFASIGMLLESPSEYDALIERIINDTEAFEVPGGRYLKWSSECGAELWMQANKRNTIIQATPYYSGHSQARIGITSREVRPDTAALDGMVCGWANPPDDGDPELGETTLAFDAPDFYCHADLKLRTTATAQIAAFGYDVTLFDSVADFRSSGAGIAPTSFFPWYEERDDGPSKDEPYATITGRILKAEKKINDLTSQPFYWVLVESFVGSFDVVFELELISTSPGILERVGDSLLQFDPKFTSTSPKVGGILSGSFWLSGRLTQYVKA